MKLLFAFGLVIAVAVAFPSAEEDAAVQVVHQENENDGVNPWHNR